MNLLLTCGKLLVIGVWFLVIVSKIGGRVYVQLPNRSSKQVSRGPVIDKHTFVGIKMTNGLHKNVILFVCLAKNWCFFREIYFQTCHNSGSEQISPFYLLLICAFSLQ